MSRTLLARHLAMKDGLPMSRPAADEQTLSIGLFGLCFFGMAVALLIPVALVDVPPLTDYPNHLARAYFLAFQSEFPVLRTMFEAQWAIIPNLALDLILPPLLKLFPLGVASQIAIGLCVLAPTSGAIALSLACFGRRSLWQFGSAFVAYNAMFLIGLMNFQIALGVALWGAAAFVRSSEARPSVRAAIGLTFGLAAFFCHLFGFLFFVLLIGSHEVARLWLARRDGLTIRKFAFRLYPLVAAAVPLAFYEAAPFADAGGETIWQSASNKLYFLADPLLGYSVPLSGAALAALAAFYGLSGALKRLLIAPMAWVAVPGLLVLYLLMPLASKGGYWIDTREPVMLALTLFATLVPATLTRSRSGTQAVVIGAAFVALFIARIALIGTVWTEAARDMASVRLVLRNVAAGSQVLAAQPLMSERAAAKLPRSRSIAPFLPSTYDHYAAFAFIDRHAFWADAFAIAGQQPVIIQPAYRVSSSDLTDIAQLRRYDGELETSTPDYFLNGWRQRYDYVLLLNAEIVPKLEEYYPGRLQLVAHDGMAALLRVIR